jgi:sporulation protein YlmC with PRC-barrel domain
LPRNQLFEERTKLKKLVMASALAIAAATAAHAAKTMAPPESRTVTNYYKQPVYDPKESKIGDIDDVLIDKSGKITGLVLGVGGFLGAGEKDAIVPFSAVKTAKKNDKWWLTIDETKDTLKDAPGFRYDRASTYRSGPFSSGLQHRKKPLPILIAQALVFTQCVQLRFGTCGVLAFALQVNNLPLQICKPALSSHHIAFDATQLVID